MTELNHAQIRADAQSETHQIGMDAMGLTGFEKYDREEASNTMGKSWRNISTLYPGNGSTISGLKACLDRLSEQGYTAVLTTSDKGRVVIEVRITGEVMDRIESQNDDTCGLCQGTGAVGPDHGYNSIRQCPVCLGEGVFDGMTLPFSVEKTANETGISISRLEEFQRGTATPRKEDMNALQRAGPAWAEDRIVNSRNP